MPPKRTRKPAEHEPEDEAASPPAVAASSSSSSSSSSLKGSKGKGKRAGTRSDDEEEEEENESTTTEDVPIPPSVCRAFAADGTFAQPGLVDHLWAAKFLDEFEPTVEVRVRFGGEGEDASSSSSSFVVDFGDDAEGYQTRKAPRVDIIIPRKSSGGAAAGAGAASSSSATYTLLLVDPDAPSRKQPEDKCALHWAVTDIPSEGGVKKGRVVLPYQPPNPHYGSHRFIFLLLQHPPSPSSSSSSSAAAKATPFPPDGEAPPRKKFDVQSFIEEHGLRPVGLNYFQQHEAEFGSGGGGGGKSKKKKR